MQIPRNCAAYYKNCAAFFKNCAATFRNCTAYSAPSIEFLWVKQQSGIAYSQKLRCILSKLRCIFLKLRCTFPETARLIQKTALQISETALQILATAMQLPPLSRAGPRPHPRAIHRPLTSKLQNTRQPAALVPHSSLPTCKRALTQHDRVPSDGVRDRLVTDTT